MSAADWPLLDPAEEDALHLTRLLTVDERPFQRISKRLLAPDALIARFPRTLPTPPPDAPDDGQLDDGEAYKRYHDDVLFDFAQLESTLIRIQFLRDANERQRARYAEEKSKILATAEAVKASTSELRAQLAEAQRVLALRKEYDVLADAILKDKALKPRDVLEAENEKLRDEIEDLEQEGADFAGIWRERKARFDHVVNEGRALVRYIKGETEDDLGEEEPPQDDEETATKDGSSNAGTPRPETDGATPMHVGDLDGDEGALAAQQTLAQRAIGSNLRHQSPADSSRGSSPAPPTDTEVSGNEMTMGDTDTPEPPSHSDTADEGEVGETESVAATVEEKMDTT